MTIIIVGAVLLLWFGTIIWAYALGQRNEARQWVVWYLAKLALNPSDEEFDITEVKVPKGEDYPPYPEEDIRTR